MILLNSVLACSRAFRVLRAWRSYVLGVTHEMACLACFKKLACLVCLKLMKCFLDLLEQGALVNCGLCQIKKIILN